MQQSQSQAMAGIMQARKEILKECASEVGFTDNEINEILRGMNEHEYARQNGCTAPAQ